MTTGTLPPPPPQYPLVPADEIGERLRRFQDLLAQYDVEAALITHKTGLFYLAGTVQPAYLYVPASGESQLFVRKNVERVRFESPLAVNPLTSVRLLPDLLKPTPRRLGMELDVMPVLTFRRYETLFPHADIVDVGQLLRQQRAVKTPFELARLRANRELAQAMLAFVVETIREGMTELDLSSRLEAFARPLRHQGLIWTRGYNMEMYWGQLLSGSSGSVGSSFDSPNGGWGLHPGRPDGASVRPIRRHEPVLMDYAVVRDGYILDQTRTLVIGDLPDELASAYEHLVAIQDAVIRAVRPGVTGTELYRLACELAADLGLADGFMGRGDSRARFVGHGVGIEVNELPVLAAGQDEPLQPGMVFALEPKYMHPSLGIVGLENTWVVTETGVERLTPEDDRLIRVSPAS